jgi:ParB/RepB/Spo0J family partition protein
MGKTTPENLGVVGAERIATRAKALREPSAREVSTRSTARLREISVFKLQSHPLQPLERTSDESIPDLVESIRTLGLQEPPLVRRMSDGSHVILAGHRRVRAWQLLALDRAVGEKIPAYVCTHLSDRDAVFVIAAEYFHRKEFSALHTARVIGEAWRERVAELGREPSSREMTSVVPWKKSAIATYRKIDEALQDPRLAPLVHRVDNPNISLMYNILTAVDFGTTRRALEVYAEHGAPAARKVVAAARAAATPDRPGRRQEPVKRQNRPAGYQLVIRVHPDMTAEDARAVLDALRAVRDDLQPILNNGAAASDMECASGDRPRRRASRKRVQTPH